LENEIGERGAWLEKTALQREGLRSRLLVPLIIQERVVGVLSAASRQPSAFSEENQHILATVAEQLAIAIQNARLYEQVQHHTAELEQRVLERTAQLNAVNHELEAFAYSVSHDLRAPLRALDGFSAALLSQYQGQLDEQGQHYLDRIQAASGRMGQLINDLLNLSRITRREMSRQQVDLSSLAQEIAAELHTSNPQRQVEVVIADEMTVQGDAPLLRIVLENLMNNAWKFTGQQPQAHIEVGMTQQSGECVYFVRDNGAGFDMAYVNKLFAPFQRLHSMQEFPGTGIGLVTVQRIITRHGGRIWTEAAVNQGAAFYFTLGDTR
jgi:light-regulated signal transduction histidine kinase (bacteriophytochrome)